MSPRVAGVTHGDPSLLRSNGDMRLVYRVSYGPPVPYADALVLKVIERKD